MFRIGSKLRGASAGKNEADTQREEDSDMREANDLHDLNHIIAEGKPKIKIDVMGVSRLPCMYIHTQILSPGTSHT